MDRSRLATLIFDSGRKLPESEYRSICEDIDTDRVTFNDISIKYKKRESIYENILFVLNDGNRVLLSEDTLTKLKSLNIDNTKLVHYMQEDIGKFETIIGVINGNS
jgi:hypothetical protein